MVETICSGPTKLGSRVQGDSTSGGAHERHVQGADFHASTTRSLQDYHYDPMSLKDVSIIKKIGCLRIVSWLINYGVIYPMENYSFIRRNTHEI